jgi:hypothetical protein
MKRSLATALLLPVALILGIWNGEDLSSLLGLSFGTLAMAAICFGCAVVIPRGLLQRILFPLGVVAVLVAGHMIGSHYVKIAFNGCVDSGETVRKNLAEYRNRTGAFPETLEAMRKQLPGRRLLRGSLLEYHRDGDGYELSFRDHWVSHRATHSDPFEARK